MGGGMTGTGVPASMAPASAPASTPAPASAPASTPALASAPASAPASALGTVASSAPASALGTVASSAPASAGPIGPAPASTGSGDGMASKSLYISQLFPGLPVVLPFASMVGMSSPKNRLGGLAADLGPVFDPCATRPMAVRGMPLKG